MIDNPDDPRHGTRHGYGRLQCRCDFCTEANRESMNRYRKSAAARLAEDPTLAEHGRISAYRNWGCRCEPCTAAHSAQCADYQERRKAAGGHPLRG